MANATNNAKIKIIGTEWFFPNYIPSIPQQALLFEQILKKTLTELQYVDRSIFMKGVSNQNFWSFELGTQEGINIPICIIIGFQQTVRQASQNLKDGSFHRPPVRSVQCIIGTERYPVAGMLLNYDNDDYSQGYGESREALIAPEKR